jgi:hypothetical protein
MITTFNTPAHIGSEASGKKSNTLFIALGLAVAGFLAYRFVIKPMMDKKNQEQKKA